MAFSSSPLNCICWDETVHRNVGNAFPASWYQSFGVVVPTCPGAPDQCGNIHTNTYNHTYSYNHNDIYSNTNMPIVVSIIY